MKNFRYKIIRLFIITILIRILFSSTLNPSRVSFFVTLVSCVYRFFAINRPMLFVIHLVLMARYSYGFISDLIYSLSGA